MSTCPDGYGCTAKDRVGWLLVLLLIANLAASLFVGRISGKTSVERDRRSHLSDQLDYRFEQAEQAIS